MKIREVILLRDSVCGIQVEREREIYPLPTIT